MQGLTARVPVELIPGLICVGVFLALAGSGGGYAVTSWGPASVFLLGLLAIVLIATRSRLREVPKTTRIALAFLAGFVAWSFLSIGWARVQGVALDGANRSLLYLIVYAIFATLVWRPRSAWMVMASYSLGLAAVGAVAIVAAIGSADPEAALIFGRFAEPTNYPNAVAALFIGGIWPALFLASRREAPWQVRGLLLASAGLLMQVALLPQSRGSLIVLPLALIVYLTVTPNRLRASIFLLAAVGATAFVAPGILDVYAIAEDGGDVKEALGAARDGMLTSFLGLLVLGSAMGFLDSRREVSARTARIAGWAAAAIAAIAAIVAIAAAVAAIGSPVEWADDRWEDFKGGYENEGFGTSRLGGDLGSNRYDFWRVGIADQFRAAPWVGEGSDNFAVTYLENRESQEEPLYPHSLPLRVLGGTGVVGALLFGGFVVAAIVGIVRSRRRPVSPISRGVAAVAVACAAYFVLHSTGDWLWSFPAIAAPVFAWLGMASRVPQEGEPAAAAPVPYDLDRKPGGSMRLAGLGLAIICGALALTSLTLPWLAARDVQIATSSWRAYPDAAFERLDRARTLNPLSAQADLTAGAIASASGDRARVRSYFSQAVDREPTSWYALLVLGNVDALEGRRDEALEVLARARSLSPTDPLIRDAVASVRRGEPMSLREIDEALIGRVCAVVGKTNETRFCD